ncbi:MAG: ThuA domain-containing protein [Oscillospiraceae bacterium]|jgi:trehalose utilization protein|nr:ThuA domain-containing protein [Oscillospiraceae bacterium]
MDKLRVTIWNEYFHETEDTPAKEYYPRGMHEHLKQALAAEDLEIRTATLEQDAEHGLTEDVLRWTDVLLWWGHCRHSWVRDDVAQRVAERVQQGMGFVPLHSAHQSKPFLRLMGTPCTLRWRNEEERCVIWNVSPNHPIARGVPLHFGLAHEEMYGEYFFIPEPEELLFLSWFEGGNVFRGGCTFTRGLGRIFYFHPGHETCPSYHNEHVLRIIGNAIRWAAPPEPREFRAGDEMERI